MKLDPTLILLRRNAWLRSWAAIVPLRGYWRQDPIEGFTSYTLRLSCSSCQQEVRRGAPYYYYSTGALFLESSYRSVEKRAYRRLQGQGCSHAVRLLQKPPLEVEALFPLELIAGTPLNGDSSPLPL